MCRHYATIRSSAHYTFDWCLLFTACVDNHGIGQIGRTLSILAEQPGPFGLGYTYSVLVSTFYGSVVP